MTGRDIQEKMTDTQSFVPKSLDFEYEGRLELDNSASALEFLTLYLVSLSTTEFKEYDEDKLLNNYQFIESRLKKHRRICSKEFLSNQPENIHYILRGNTCFTFTIKRRKRF